MIFKKKMITPDMDDWHHDPCQLLLHDSHELADLSERNTAPSKTLAIFIGGAMDDVYRPLLNGVFIPYRLKQADYQDIGYATHAATRQVAELVEHWYRAGQKVCLVGHSWGGNAAIKVANKLSSHVCIELLITLDSVSRRLFRRPINKPDNVKQWINVHVDYRLASMEYSNMVARAGGYWGHCQNADSNIKLSRDKHEEITHMKADRMFKEVEDIIKAI